MRDWLLEHGVTIAAMESTSTYWKAPFYCLEDVMEVWLLNAAHMKAVPGRKGSEGNNYFAVSVRGVVAGFTV
jgi:transposase